MKIQHLDLTELPILFLYFFLILFIALAVKNSYYDKKDPTRPYFIPALLARMLGALAIGAVYDFYYGAGDTFAYYEATKYLFNSLLQEPSAFLDLLYGILTNAPLPKQLLPPYLFTRSYMMIALLSLPFYVLGVGYYYVMILLIAVFSFIINWNLFRLFYSMTRSNIFFLAFGMLFFPNQVIWTSGLFKDTYVFIGIAVLLLFSYKILNMQPKNWFKISLYVLLMSLTLLIMKYIKGYVANGFLPFLLLWVALKMKKQIHPLVRQTIYPVFLILMIASSFLIIQEISQESKWAPERVLQFAVEHRQDLLKDRWYQGKSNDSRYDIGDFEPTVEGVLSKAPESLVATLFRPFIWEVNNPLMIISALEGLIVLLITVYVLWSVGLVRFIQVLISNDDLKFTLGYALFFGFFVGLTSGNFGNLVRYKTPAMPFYFISLSIVYYYGFEMLKIQKKQKFIVSELAKKRKGPSL